ncbi:MAG TPA: DegV family protein, partial [Thermoanaerobacterales bacterium]|nr:DegV family protein [Thermoanaerobacterales bacterium]
IPKELAEKMNITIVPLYVLFGKDTYRDGIDIRPDEFYEMQGKSDELPKTSQPSVGEFTAVYEELLNDYDEIISIHISSGLSGTVNAALRAKEQFGNKVKVVDSKTISLGIGLQVMEAARKAIKGINSERIINRIEEIKNKSELLFTLDTLKYLEKGGRIGKVSSLLGSFLNIKPIVRVVDGIYVPAGKTRSQRQSIVKIVEIMETFLENRKPEAIVIGHGKGYEMALELKRQVEDRFEKAVDFLTDTGPVIGVHTGPGTLGIAFY